MLWHKVFTYVCGVLEGKKSLTEDVFGWKWKKTTTTTSSMLISESLSYHSDETMSFNGLVEKEKEKKLSRTEGRKKKRQLSSQVLHTIAGKLKYRSFYTVYLKKKLLNFNNLFLWYYKSRFFYVLFYKAGNKEKQTYMYRVRKCFVHLWVNKQISREKLVRKLVRMH